MATAEPETYAPAVKLTLPPDLLTTFETPAESSGFADRFKAFLELPIIRTYHKPTLDAALALANSVRNALGMGSMTELKSGVKGDGSRCVIAATILDGYDGSKGIVSVGGDGTHVGNKMYNHPPAVAQFIERFDHGAYPDLDIAKKN